MMKLDIQKFATSYYPSSSGTTINSQNSTGTGGYRHKIILRYRFYIDDVARTYKIECREQFYHEANVGPWSSGSPYNRLLIGGVVKAKSEHQLNETSGSGTFDICPTYGGSTWTNMGTFSYDNNGKGSTHSIGVSCGWASSWGGISRKTTTHNITPPDIDPASSSITSVTDTVLGNAPTIKWTPLVSTYRYKVKYTCSDGGASVTTNFITPNKTTEYTYNSQTLAINTFVSHFTTPNSIENTFTATLYTYTASSDTPLGSNSKTFKVTLPDSVKPSGTVGAFSEAGSVPTGWGIFVKGKSKLSFTVSGTPYDSGSSIAKLSTAINGTTYSYTSSGAAGAAVQSSIATDTISSNGTATLTITDSRGRTGTASRNYTVVDYSAPTVSLTAKRALSSGTESEEGTYCHYSITVTYQSCKNGSVEKNSLPTFKIGYRQKGNGNYAYTNISPATGTTTNNRISFTKTGTFGGGQLDVAKNYEIQVVVTDGLSESAYDIEDLLAQFKLVNYKSNGKGIGIGKKSSTDNLIDINMNVKVTGTLTGSLTGPSTKLGTSNVGSSDRPIYLSSGSPSTCNTPASGAWWRGVPFVTTGGVSEIGKYLDFHNSNTSTNDYDVRLQSDGANQNIVKLPTVSGTLLTNNDLYYPSGTTVVELGRGEASYTYFMVLTGYVSSSTSKIFFQVRLPKRIDNITNITVNNAKFEMRGDKGYVASLTGYQEWVNQSKDSGYTKVTAVKVQDDPWSILLCIYKQKSSSDTTAVAFTNLTNNRLVEANGYLKLTLS